MNETTGKAKQEIFNLIILDESGSMSGVTKQTIDGCNETLNTIRYAQKEFTETQIHYASIYAFQSGGEPSRYIVKNYAIDLVENIGSKDYCPGGCTPLYDAIGMTLADLKALTANRKNAIGHVTIITDGYENSSTQYTHEKVVKMINALKEMGWNFSFIGANIDVERTAQSFSINNYMQFDSSQEGTHAMFQKESKARRAYYRKMDRCIANEAPCASFDDRIMSMKDISFDYFKDEDDKE